MVCPASHSVALVSLCGTRELNRWVDGAIVLRMFYHISYFVRAKKCLCCSTKSSSLNVYPRFFTKAEPCNAGDLPSVLQ